MESWVNVLRDGIFAQEELTDEGLLRLRDALKGGSKRLIKGATTEPPTVLPVLAWPCEGACPIATLFTPGLFDPAKPATVEEAENAFAEACVRCDRLVGNSASTRWFTNAWDLNEISLAELLAEVEREIGRRQPNALTTH